MALLNDILDYKDLQERKMAEKKINHQQGNHLLKSGVQYGSLFCVLGKGYLLIPPVLGRATKEARHRGRGRLRGSVSITVDDELSKLGIMMISKIVEVEGIS